MKHTMTIRVLVLAIAATSVASAQTQRSGNDTARVMQQVQQLTAEKAQLQTELTAVRKELDDLKAKQVQATAAQDKLQQRIKELSQTGNRQQTGTRDAEAQLEKSRTQIQELLVKYREVTDTLKQVETEKAAAIAQQAVQKRDLSACVDRNAQMYLLSNEVLNKLGDRGLWSALKTRESFTQISRVRLNNLIEDYRYRVDELTVNSATTPQRE